MKLHRLIFHAASISTVDSFLVHRIDVCRKTSNRLASTLDTIEQPSDNHVENSDEFPFEIENVEGLNNKTTPFLDVQKYPLGSLPSWAVTSSLDILNSLARTSSYRGATTATSILKRLENEADAGNSDINLSVMHYSIVTNAWAKSNDNEAGIKAEKVLEDLIKRSKVDSFLAPNRVMLNCIIHAWSRQGNMKRAEQVFEGMKADPEIEVESADYNALLAGYARAGEARKAEELLKIMLELEIYPDLISYNCVLDAWRHSNEAGAAERANSILRTMQENFDEGLSNISPNAKSYSIVAAAFVNSGGKDSARQIERILSIAESRGFIEDAYLSNTILDALATTENKDAPFKAEETLEAMIKKGIANTVSFNTVLKAWKLSDHKEAALRAKAILKRMECLSTENSNISVSPDPFSYALVIQCCTKMGETAKAISLFHKMLNGCRLGNKEMKPNTTTLNVVLDALAKSNDKGSSEEAYKLLLMFRNSSDPCMEDVKLSSVSYTSVIDAFAKNKNSNSAQRAVEVFKLMESDFRAGNIYAKPNTRSFNTLMNAWVQTGQKENMIYAQQVLERMEDEYKNGNDDVLPNVYSYSILMNGWSRFPTSLEETTTVFNRMVEAYNNGNNEAKPNSHSFGSLIHATANSGRSEAPMEAERLLKTIYKHYVRGNDAAKPNTQSFTVVINSWAKAGRHDSGERAQALLEWMIELYNSDKDFSFKPNEVTWNVAISAWAKARVFSKSIRAEQLLNRMIEIYEKDKREAKPNTHVYTAVLSAAAYTMGEPEEKRYAFEIAERVMDNLDRSNYGKPNHITYSTYFNACYRLLSEEDARFSAIQRRFKRCCSDGMVNDLVLQKVKNALTEEQFLELLGESVSTDGSIIFMDKLPMSDWGRNVKERKRSR